MKIKIRTVHFAVLFAIVTLANFTLAQTVEKKTSDPDSHKQVIASAMSAANTGSDALSVSYFEKSKVDEAFAKGAVLFDGSNGRNYMIITGRRDKPGQAELHTKDTDVIYVLQGTATFVTGGEVVDGKTVSPDEIRGSSIKSGEIRKLSQGDIIIVPHGTPHQFTEVASVFLYLVVKVR